MARDTKEDVDEAQPAPRKRRPILRFFQITLVVLVAVLVIAWLRREEIAREFITDTLAGYGIEATYDIESIEPGAQVLTNLVIGDPDAPDLTVERAEVRITPRMGLPTVSTIVLENPRLWGRVVDGQPSFGALDPLIFTGSDQPFEFPDMVLTVIDGRALIEGDYGPVALKLDGSGHLRGGFAGEIAAVAPHLQLPGCTAQGATLFGEVGIDAERPHFDGPLRFARLECAGSGFEMADAAIAFGLRADRTLAAFEGTVGLQAGQSSVADNGFAAIQGGGRYTYRDTDLTSQFSLEGRDFSSSAARLAVLQVDGMLRGVDNFDRMELDASLSGRNMQPGGAMDDALAQAASAAQDTLAAPLLQRFRAQLGTELRGSNLDAIFIARSEAGRSSVVIPEARLTGRSGASLFLLTRGQLAIAESGIPLFSGNFATGGEGLPQISGRMEQEGTGALELRMQMREYAAGDASLALPQLNLRQGQGGGITLSGNVEASGPLPGGFAQGLKVPVNGTISPSGAVSMWSRCTDIAFDSLQLADLALQRQSLTLCPPSGRSILRYDANGLALAAGTPSLQLAGLLGETPLQVRTGAVGLAWPGALSVKDADVVLGAPDNAARFALADLSATLGDTIGGDFTGADVKLDALPLDILQAGGTWDFTDGVLSLAGVRFVLEDRDKDPLTQRFKPLMARGAALRLADNVVTSQFALDHPASGSRVARVDLEHNLSSAAGHADLFVDAVTFTPDFQPTDLTESLRGTVSLVDGTVFGRGRIDWSGDAITSTGRFTSESLDLAAAFGPVKGARGTIEFSDLLGLTTVPNQKVYVAQINPGVEVFDGEVTISLIEGSRLTLEDARWPFMGGTLTMRPVTLSIGLEEVRRYELVIEGLEARLFIEHMELDNLSATGVFDGTIPVVFDEMGNGSLEGGLLVSRAPGGSVSYIGELTYEDLTPIANYAFDSLRALEYDRMQIELNGSLIGDLITSVSFDGVRQGAGAQSNFVTRRLARLPIRFVVNVRAPFYSMMNDLRSLYDPSSVRDPRSLGLVTDDGTRLTRPGQPVAAPAPEELPQDPAQVPESETAALRGNEPDIQPPESEAMP